MYKEVNRTEPYLIGLIMANFDKTDLFQNSSEIDRHFPGSGRAGVGAGRPRGPGHDVIVGAPEKCRSWYTITILD
jgi:hypothetical protein